MSETHLNEPEPASMWKVVWPGGSTKLIKLVASFLTLNLFKMTVILCQKA